MAYDLTELVGPVLGKVPTCTSSVTTTLCSTALACLKSEKDAASARLLCFCFESQFHVLTVIYMFSVHNPNAVVQQVTCNYQVTHAVPQLQKGYVFVMINP